MISFVISVLATGLAFFVLERLVLPKPSRRAPFSRRTLWSAAPVVLFYFTILMATYRPYMAAALSIATFIVILLCNNAKYRALREPLVFTDFALLKEALAHPRLYVGYIGPWRLAGLAALTIAAVAGCLYFEPPLIERHRPLDWMPSAVYLATMAAMIWLVTRGVLRPAFTSLLERMGSTLRVTEDVADLSLLVCLICYFYLSGAPMPSPERRKQAIGRRAMQDMRQNGRVRRPPPPPESLIPETLPDILVLQSESFFDARRLGTAVDRDLLPNFDRVRGAARYRGRLKVPAWGANTMRTEHAFLSGMPNEALGYRRFNPYLTLQNEPSWSFLHMLRLFGYVCVCVHPFDPAFFNRDKVFPNLGFYRFIGIEDFNGAERNGPYVSDGALAAKIIDVLEGSQSPTFVFGISMENHGTWRAGRFGVGEDAADGVGAPYGSPALARYLRHLQSADDGIGALADYLAARARPSVFGFYGDHLPSLPELFRRTGFDSHDTDYFVWTPQSGSSIEVDVAAETLGRFVLDAALTPQREMG